MGQTQASRTGVDIICWLVLETWAEGPVPHCMTDSMTIKIAGILTEKRSAGGTQLWREWTDDISRCFLRIQDVQTQDSSLKRVLT